MADTTDNQPKIKYGVRDPVRGSGDALDELSGAQPEPIRYEAFSTLLSDQVNMVAPVRRDIPETEVEKRAIWIVHGMGQQIPFETLDGLTEGILRVAKPPDEAQGFTVSACSIRVGDEVLQRVELKVRSADGKKVVELHLYEAYWAPITEGVAKLRDVIGFLINGALRGILNSRKKFKRAMFGKICDFKIRKRVPLEISAVLIILGALAVINAVIVVATGQRLGIHVVPIGNSAQSWGYLTAIASGMSALGITLGAILFLAESCKSGDSTAFRRKLLSRISWTGTVVTSVALVAAGFLFLLALLFQWTPVRMAAVPARQLQFLSTVTILCAVAMMGLAMWRRARSRSEGKPSAGQTAKQRVPDRFVFTLLIASELLLLIAFLGIALSYRGVRFPWPHWLNGAVCVREALSNPIWVWPFLIFLSSKIRTLMVEYVGDVVIYVTSNKIDRFSKARQEIKNVAYKSLSAVFKAMPPGGTSFEYEQVAIVGHSLGSVIAYDTLNRLINEDRMTDAKMRIVERTCLLETFGSPLDKIAFFFTIQGTDNIQIREQLAESVQPLIMNYKYRPYPWINVRSLNDIISGEMYLYDWPGPNSPAGTATEEKDTPVGYHRVIDETDPDACVALAAHVDYWKNKLVWQKLYEYVTQ